MRALSWLLTVLFCWIIFPYKWTKKALFEAKKANAIREAEMISIERNKQVYVVQYRTDFIVGLRDEFRRKDSKIRRKIDGFLNWDYRNSIVHKTK